MKLHHEALVKLIALAAGGAASAQDVPRLMKEINRTPGDLYGMPVNLTPTAGKVFFAVDDKASGSELWCTDGSPQGTRQVKDIYPGPGSSTPHDFVASGGSVFFLADDGVHGSEWWTSDGTAAGTKMIADVTPGPLATLPPIPATLVEGKLYFFVPSASVAGEWDLWSSNGTSAGTQAVAEGFSNPAELTACGGLVYFAERMSPDNTTKLWRSDGSFGGTIFLADVTGGPGGEPGSFTAASDTLFLVRGHTLWKSNGSPQGTGPVMSIQRTGDLSMVALQGSVYFVADDEESGPELWTSDGSSAGTHRVTELIPGAQHQAPQHLHVAGGRIFFSMDGKLWSSDGSAEGTVELYRFKQEFPTYSHTAGGTVTYLDLLVGRKRELLRSDGTPGGTTVIPAARKTVAKGRDRATIVSSGDDLFFVSHGYRDPRDYDLGRLTAAGKPVLLRSFAKGSGNTEQPVAASENASLAVLGNEVFFTENPSSPKWAPEIWASDGTSSGTRRVARPKDSYFWDLEVLGGQLFYSSRVRNVPELWWTDGASNATHRAQTPKVKGPVYEMLRVDLNGTVFYAPLAENPGELLSRTDGTVKGTRRVMPDEASAVPAWEAAIFTHSMAEAGHELWACDGSREGTRLLADIWPGPYSSSPKILGKVGTRTFFQATQPSLIDCLWVTEGSPATTRMVRPLDGALGMRVRDFIAFKGEAYFIGHGLSTFGLWRSDGTEAGTVLVKQLALKSGQQFSDAIPCLTEMNGVLYFNSHGDSGAELWKSDGTTAGTVPLVDIFPGLGSSDPRNLLAVGPTLCFSADDGVHGYELWKSDGTAAGTRQVADLTQGDARSSYPGNLTVCGTKLFFYANVPGVGRELHVLDLD